MRADIAARRPGLKIGYHHFALFRGSLDGLSLDVLGDRYLETGTDLRQAKRTLAWVRDELIAAAKRFHRETGVTSASFARLLRLKPEPLAPEDRIALAEIPSLEDFQADYDPSGFYSEAELIEEFEKRYGGSFNPGPTAAAMRKVERNERLRTRLRKAIDTLENWLATTPKPGDPISIWIEAVVAQHLTAAGILSIEDLVGLINRKGNLWYRRIPKFGAVRAKRMVRWLQLNQVLPLEPRALVPYQQISQRLPALRPKESGIVPIESLALTARQDGSLGANRGHESQLRAVNDLEAIEAWLDFVGDNPHTRRAYRAQAERFLLFLTMEKGKAFSDAGPEDCLDYLRFTEALATPGCPWPWRTLRPQWIGAKTHRWSPEWRPFTGDMALRSRAMAVTLLKGLCGWLVDQVGYLRKNPWGAVKTPKVAGKVKVDHALNARQWAAINDQLMATARYVENHAEDERFCRLRFVLWLGYSGGLRQDEMIRLKAENLRRDVEGHWDLVFLGKGGKEREVPLSAAVFVFLQDYLEARGHGRNPLGWEKTTPLLTALSGEAERLLPKAQKVLRQQQDSPSSLPEHALDGRTLAQIIKRHFDDAAERIDDLIDAHQLRQASTHWLRHTAATNMINQGAQVAVVQEILGHASAATTSLYTHASRKQKRAAVEAVV